MRGSAGRLEGYTSGEHGGRAVVKGAGLPGPVKGASRPGFRRSLLLQGRSKGGVKWDGGGVLWDHPWGWVFRV